jgi:hypothetical protein
MGFLRTRDPRVLLLLILAISSTSCLIFTRAQLFDARKSAFDQRLRGRWIGTGELKDVYATFDGKTTLESNIIAGKGPTKPSELFFDIVTGSIGKYPYMSIRLRENPGEDGYLLARYSIHGDELKVWLLDSTLIDAAITEGKLKSNRGQSSSTTLTDSPATIAAFIKANEDSDQLVEFLGVFKRAGH